MSAARSPGPPPPPPVLLGVRDAAVEEGSRCSWDTSKAGGTADGVPGVTLEFPHCTLCTDLLVHLVQVYCPLEGSPYHRTINVWACLQPGCWGRCESWKVLRSQWAETQCPRSAEERRPVSAPTDWCADADDWCVEETVGSPGPGASGPPSPGPDTDVSAQTRRLQALSVQEPPEEGAALTTAPAPGFRPFYIAVIEEVPAGSPPLAHEQQLLRAYQSREGVTLEQIPFSGGGDGAGAETYEKSEVWHGDVTFVKFMKRISSCPEQILRYSWNGQPLLIAPLPVGMDLDIPACGNCGGRRVFEFQLMPALVSLLRSMDGKEASVEFGTVLVFTCERSCWSPSNQRPLEECAVVQADPDTAFFR